MGFPNNVSRDNLLDQYSQPIYYVLTISSGLTSNTRWTTQLINIYICVGST